MKVKTALGKTLDMGALVLRNEKIRAVGNMKVNARGDIIDSNNKIITPVNDRVANKYAKTVGNRSANFIEKKNNYEKPLMAKEDTELLKALEEFDAEDVEIEKVKGNGKNGK